MAAALPLALWGGFAVPSLATPSQRLQGVQSRISRAQDRQAQEERRAGVLSTQVAAAGRQIAALDLRLAALRGREARVTQRLDSELNELARTQRDLRFELVRLTRLRARLKEGRRRLASRLVELYKADNPDIVTVILNADGFAALIDDAAFMQRISRQDRHVLTFVERARAESERKETELKATERRQAIVTQRIEGDRAALADIRAGVEAARTRGAQARDARRRQLGAIRVSVGDLRGEVRSLQAVQARITAKLNAAQRASSGPAPVAGPPTTGSGEMIWPVDGPITSPFCERRSYEACHPGLDIGVPEGTPIRAAAAGTVVLMQSEAASGGYGNYTCLDHGGGLATCYAHQSRFGTSLGARVAQGQVIGYVGNTGHSFGAHLHFEVRVGGGVTNPLDYL